MPPKWINQPLTVISNRFINLFNNTRIFLKFKDNTHGHYPY